MEPTAYRQFAELEENPFRFRGRRSIFFRLLDRFLKRECNLDVLEVNLTVSVPAPINEILYRVMSSGRHLLTRFALWCGHSLTAVVQRPPR